MNQPCPGYDEMPGVIKHAPNDIAPHLWTLYWLVRAMGMAGSELNLVELGVRRGDSTRALLAGARDVAEIRAARNRGFRPHLWSYDIEDVGEHVKEVSRNQGFTLVEDLWTFRHLDSLKAGELWRHTSIDLLFVDTDHSFETTKAEIAAWHQWIKVGGCMVFHDTNLNEPGRDGVLPAIKDFLDNPPGSILTPFLCKRYWAFENHPHIAEGDTGLGILWRVG